MRTDELLELIHGEVDGVNSDADSALLRAHLAQNPKDKQLFCEFQQIATALNSLTEISPTKGLRDDILGSVAWPKRNRLAEWVTALRPSPPALKLGFAFALGCLVALVGTQLSPETGSRGAADMTDMIGTMVPREAGARPEGQGHVLIQSERVAGSVTARLVDGVQVLEVDLSTAEALELVAEYASGDFLLEAVVNRSDHFPSVTETGGTLVISDHGRHRYALLLRGIGTDDGNIKLGLYSAGELIYENTLPLISRK